MTINYARESVIDFTKPFMNLGISILFKVTKTGHVLSSNLPETLVPNKGLILIFFVWCNTVFVCMEVKSIVIVVH
jgi:hypothetical protein